MKKNSKASKASSRVKGPDTSKKTRQKAPAVPAASDKPEIERHRRGVSFKTLAIVIVVSLAITVPGAIIGIMLLKEAMLIRAPVLIQKDAKVTFVLGDVMMRDGADARWKQAIVGYTLSSGCELRTEKNSIADIRFNDGFAIRISADSLFRLDKLNVKNVNLNLQQGALYGKFEKLYKENEINIKTPTAIAAVRGTDLGFEVSREKKAKKLFPFMRKAAGPGDDDEGELLTTVYSLSGITELFNPKFERDKLLLSYQSKLTIKDQKPPEKIEKLTEEEATRIRSLLNSLHFEEVLLISDKINFKLGEAKILPASFPELDKIAAILKEKKVRVRIEGHTDSISNDTINQALSVDRAKSIRNYLVGKGIERKYLEIAGYGSSKPIASNKTEDGRAQNRRVEFIIIEK